MFYLVDKESKVVDKSVSKFPVHESLEWVESEQDMQLGGLAVTFTDGNLLKATRNDSMDLLIAKADKEKLLIDSCTHAFMMGDDTAKINYANTYRKIGFATTIEELDALEV